MPTRKRNLFSQKTVRTGCTAQSAYCSMCVGFFPGAKRPGRQLDHSLPSSAEV